MTESRRLLPRGQVPPPSRPETGRAGWPDRPGPQGGLRTAYTGPYVRCTRTTHSGPLQGPTGPASLYGLAPRAKRAGWVYPRITHPVYPPCTHPARTAGPVDQHGRRPARCTMTVDGTTGTCTYDRFEDALGEPRGVEHTLYFRGPDGILNGPCFTRFAPDYDWNRVMGRAKY